MSDLSKSYKRILTSTSITGGATVANIIVGVIRTKIIAMLLGPTGIGLIGLLQSFVATATTLVGMGIPTAASRQIATKKGGHSSIGVETICQALFLGVIALGVIGCLTIWFFKDTFALLILDSSVNGNTVGLLSLAVLFSTINAAQLAVLQGMREINVLAKINVVSGMIGSAVGILIIWKLKYNGISIFLVALPITSLILSAYYFRKNFSFSIMKIRLLGAWNELRIMAKLGLALFFFGLLEQITFLLIRSVINGNLGGDQLGYFQAAWTIAVMYFGVISGAMANDFMPRVAEHALDNGAVNKIINQQTEIGILIAAPIIVLMMGCSPFIISFMYTEEFNEASNLMKLLLLSDILKLISWPIGIALVGIGDGTVFIRQGPIQLLILLSGVYLLTPIFGLTSVGFAMIFTQSLGFIWGYFYMHSKTGYLLDNKIKIFILILFIINLLIFFISSLNNKIGAVLAIVFSLIIAIFSYKDIRSKVSIE